MQGLQVKNDPTQSEQLTTICSDWVGPFNLEGAITLDATEKYLDKMSFA